MTVSRLALLLAIACGACSFEGELTGDFRGDKAFRIYTECAPDGTCQPVCENTGSEDVCSEAVPPANGGCWITGIGHLIDTFNNDGKDNFGGNGMPMKDGRIRGEWEHVDHGTGVKYHAKVEYLVCRRIDEPGPGVPDGPNDDFVMNQTFYGGPARRYTHDTGWLDGFWIDIVADDHGEPGNQPGPGQHGSRGPDSYYFSARPLHDDGTAGAILYEAGLDIEGGNFQMHPPNSGHPYTSSTLPEWVLP